MNIDNIKTTYDLRKLGFKVDVTVGSVKLNVKAPSGYEFGASVPLIESQSLYETSLAEALSKVLDSLKHWPDDQLGLAIPITDIKAGEVYKMSNRLEGQDTVSLISWSNYYWSLGGHEGNLFSLFPNSYFISGSNVFTTCEIIKFLNEVKSVKIK